VEDLRRGLAPVSAAAWQAIDCEARRVLKLNLAARKLVDFHGPLGWKESSVSLGRAEPLRSPPLKGVDAALRRVLPLVELRARFELSRAELDDIGRGASDPDLSPLVEAAKQIARAEDRSVFHGYGAGQIHGICEASPHGTRPIPSTYAELPRAVAEAINTLREAGVDGPYGIAVSPRIYAGLMQATQGGYPVLKLVGNLVEDRVVWAPAVEGVVVLSLRGGDYLLTVGQDLSIGYAGHGGSTVELYLLESFTFQVLAAEAAVALTEEGQGKKRA
jgi:uncharacterized linocin/CFP29 family protein